MTILAGERLDANGLLDPNDRVPERLDYVFGEQPVESSPDFFSEKQQTERGTWGLLIRVIGICVDYAMCVLYRARLSGRSYLPHRAAAQFCC
ncbi:hypothetical protein EON64_07805 [archaeon]|nr:MAG: hypothetical protein EON64_07805 [archaeon]